MLLATHPFSQARALCAELMRREAEQAREIKFLTERNRQNWQEACAWQAEARRLGGLLHGLQAAAQDTVCSQKGRRDATARQPVGPSPRGSRPQPAVCGVQPLPGAQPFMMGPMLPCPFPPRGAYQAAAGAGATPAGSAPPPPPPPPAQPANGGGGGSAATTTSSSSSSGRAGAAGPRVPPPPPLAPPPPPPPPPRQSSEGSGRPASPQPPAAPAPEARSAPFGVAAGADPGHAPASSGAAACQLGMLAPAATAWRQGSLVDGLPARDVSPGPPHLTMLTQHQQQRQKRQGPGAASAGHLDSPVLHKARLVVGPPGTPNQADQPCAGATGAFAGPTARATRASESLPRAASESSDDFQCGAFQFGIGSILEWCSDMS